MSDAFFAVYLKSRHDRVWAATMFFVALALAMPIFFFVTWAMIWNGDTRHLGAVVLIDVILVVWLLFAGAMWRGAADSAP